MKNDNNKNKKHDIHPEKNEARNKNNIFYLKFVRKSRKNNTRYQVPGMYVHGKKVTIQ